MKDFIEYVANGDENDELAKVKAERDYALHCLEREIAIAQQAQTEAIDLRSQLGKERHDVFAQCEALVCARILDWTAAVEGGVHESFATTVLEEFEDFLKSIRDARASGSNPVSKDASMEGRGVDPMLRGATSPTLTDEKGK